MAKQSLLGTHTSTSTFSGKPNGFVGPGLYNATFVGFTDPITRENRFASCPECKRDPSTQPVCGSCMGTGNAKKKVLAARYIIEADGREELEEMTAKLSKGGQLAGGRVISASTLYLRAWMFTGEADPAKLEKYDWEGIAVPVQLLVKANQRGFMRISDVLLRAPAPTSAPPVTSEDPPF